jgi:hypothetical protein
VNVLVTKVLCWSLCTQHFHSSLPRDKFRIVTLLAIREAGFKDVDPLVPISRIRGHLSKTSQGLRDPRGSDLLEVRFWIVD